WSDAPIIEEYESDSDDKCVSVQTKGLDTPSFANKQVKTPRENVKNQSTHSQKPKVNNKELGHGFTERACFGNGTGERKPTWNNAQRVNKQNQFVPLAVQTRTGNNPVNTAKVKEVSTVGEKWDTAVKSSAGCKWRTPGYNNNILSKYNGGSSLRNYSTFKDPLGRLKPKQAWVPKRV
ncbi:hypothetical protein Tco_1305440, partial [Tanacetum coccineum]